MKKINILNFNHIWWKTWSAQFIDTLMQGLPEKEFDYHTLVGYKFRPQKNTTSLYQTSESRRYRNLRYKLAVGLNFLFDLMTPWAITLDSLHHFKPYQKADIIHLHCPQGGYFDWRDLPQICKEKKVLMTMHDDWIVSGNDPENLFHPYKTKSQYLKRRKIFEQCRMTYVWVSNWITNKILKDGIAGKNAVQTIYNGINTDIFYKRDKKLMRKELGLPQHKKVIISIAGSGGKTNAKGLWYVQQMIKEYQHNTDYLFLTLWNFKEKKVSDVLRELGYISQEKVAQYFSAADVFLYPTLMDTCPLVVIECLACWCPIVSFATAWVPEIIQHKQNGYVATRKEYQDLKMGFEWTVHHQFMTISLDPTFTQKQMTKQYRQLYLSV